MKPYKCDTYTAKETLGYMGRKYYTSVARVAAKREEKQRREKKHIYRKITGAPQ